MAPSTAGADFVANVLGTPALVEPLDERLVAAEVERRLFGQSEPVTMDRYRLESKLGEGGGGVVYRAYDPQLDRPVAIKMFRTRGPHLDVRRLRREGQALARMHHPNVVEVYDAFPQDRGVAVVMAWIDGTPLDAWLRRRRQPVAAILDAFVAAGRGLAAVHAEGWVHRDFKPANVLLDRRGQVRLADFGLAQPIGESPLSEAAGDDVWMSSTASGERITGPGQTPGTPGYLAPEVVAGARADVRSDQYAFCASLFEALYGVLPDEANADDSATLRRVPPRIRHAVARGLSADPDRRFASMTALLRALAPRRIRRGWLVAGALAAMSLVAVARGDASPAATNPCAGDAEALPQRLRESTVDRLEPELAARMHDYARTWSDAYARACSGTVQYDRVSPTLRCLDRQRDEFEALLAIVADEDEVRPSVTAAAVHRLRAPARCADVDERTAAQWQPEDPEARALASRLRKQLAYAQGLSYAGRHADAAEAMAHLADAAREAGLSAIVVQVEVYRGGTLVTAGEPRRGRDVLAKAYEVAVAEGFDYDATTIATDLVFAEGYTLGDAEAGRQWARHAQAGLDRLSLSGESQARLDSHQGSMESLAGRHVDAERFHRRAAAVRRRDAKTNPGRLASTLNNLGNVVLRQDRVDEALELHQEALVLRERAFGRFHPHVAVSLNNIGSIAMLRGDWDLAESKLLAALKVWEATSGPNHRNLVHPLSNLANVTSSNGHLRRAEAYARRGLDVAIDNDGPDAPYVGTMHLALGRVLGDQGRNEEALESLFSALRITNEAFGAEHDDIALIEHAIGGRYLARGQLDVAAQHMRVALRHWEGPEHRRSVHRNTSELRMALIELRQGKAEVAMRRLLALQADDVIETLRAQSRSEIEFALARATVALNGSADDAQRHARAALASLDPRQHNNPALEGEIRRWLDNHVR